MRLGALAAHVLHQAALVAGLFRAGLELVELVAGAAMVHQHVGVEAWPGQFVEVGRLDLATGQTEQRLGHPVGMGRTAGDIDHRQPRRDRGKRRRAGRRWRSPSYCRPQASVGLLPADGDAAVGRAGAHRDDMARPGGQPAHPLDHRPFGAGEDVEAAAALRAAQQRTLDAKHVQRQPSLGAVFENGQRFGAARLGNARMPKHLDAGIGQRGEQRAPLAAQPGERAAAATAGLQPEQVHSWRSSP